MPRRILCPECDTSFAYSPALLGRTVRCRQCGHEFLVLSPPVAELPVAAHAVADGLRVLSPPPLPVRAATERPPVADGGSPADHRPRRQPARRERPGDAGVLAALGAAFVLGLAVIIGGLIYIVWPSSSKSTNPAGVGPSPAVVAPVDPEPVRRFEDIMREAPQKGDRPRWDGEGAPDPRLRPGGPPAAPAIRPVAPAAPARPAGDGPKFAAVVPVRITPAQMAGDRDEIPLPGPVESVAVAGGGRYLLLHVPRTRHVVVFDVSAAKVVRRIDVPDPNAMVAGGMNLFVIYQPGKNAIERWSCEDFRRLLEVKSPFRDPVTGIAMGCASDGPLVVALSGSRRTVHGGSTLAYYGPATMREVTYPTAGDRNPFGIGDKGKRLELRVCAQGNVVTAWGPNAPGCQCDEIHAASLTRHWDLHAPSPLLPAPDGSLLFGPGETLRPDLRGGRGPRPDVPVYCVPAVSGNAFVSVRGRQGIGAGDDAHTEAVAIYQIGKDAPVVAFDAADDIDLSRADQGLDQTVILIPEAKVLITVAGPKRTKLVLRRVELK